MSALTEHLEMENARLRLALHDCNQGLNDTTLKLVYASRALGLEPDLPLAEFAAACRASAKPTPAPIEYPQSEIKNLFPQS